VGWSGLATPGNGCQQDLRAEHLAEVETTLMALASDQYDCAYVLNQHRRALVRLPTGSRGERTLLHGPLGETLTHGLPTY